ncbi:putative lipoprotein [Trichinella spiralis]|uniref:Lipoprotein n=1 Tax=Trichinella spiralis TaxID=6334 RepID=A0ABR3K2A8_TRISP
MHFKVRTRTILHQKKRSSLAFSVEHLKVYFQTDDINCEEKNGATLLSTCGLATYAVVSLLLSSILKTKLQFHKRQRFYNESVTNFTASENCNFDSVLTDIDW